MIKLNIFFMLTALALLTEHTVLFPGQDKGNVMIGEQIWMAQNLDGSTFRNGDPLPQAKTAEEWEEAGKNGRPAWCYYENKTVNGKIFGKLYNWYAVSDNRNLAPPGWHVPDAAEWRTLIVGKGGDDLAAGELKEKTSDHLNPSGSGAGNDRGFCALPGGYRDNNGRFFSLGNYAAFWSSTAADTHIALARHMSRADLKVYHDYVLKSMGFSVRCIRDFKSEE